MKKQEHSIYRQKYHVHKNSTIESRNGVPKKDKNGNIVEFRLSFEEWFDIWTKSGHLHERGRKKGQYCMSRFNDIGHYEVGNVFIQEFGANTKEAHLGKKAPKSEAWKKSQSRAQGKGVIINGQEYHSIKSAAIQTGHAKETIVKRILNNVPGYSYK